MTTSWQSFANTFMSSDFLKGAISGLTSFIEGLEKVIDTVGTFPALMGTIAAGFSLFKNDGIFKTFNNDLDGFANKIGIANKSFAELSNIFKSANTGGIKGFFSGLKSMGEALTNPLSKVDLSAINAYNKLIDDGVDGQEAFAKTMGNTSAAAKDLVQSANGGKVALNGMKTASIGAKIGLIGAKAAAIAFNAAITMGISLLIDWAISGIQKVINAKKDLAEEVEELTSKFKEQSEELQKLKGDYNTDNESSMISRYGKLSKGVDGLGRNISLTADEYSEYQSIVNKIAEQIPSLVSGYNEEGNAILNNVDSVEALNKAYQNLIKTQNETILSSTNKNKIQNNWENTINQANGYDRWESFGNFFSFDGFFGGETSDFDMKTDTAEWLSGLSSKTSQESIEDYLKDSLLKQREITQFLQNAGYDVNQYSSRSHIAETLKEALDNDLAGIESALSDYYKGFDTAVAEYKTIATSLLNNVFEAGDVIEGWDYGGITEELQNIAYKTVNSLDFDFLNNLSQQGKTIEQWTNELLNQLNTVGKTHGEYITDSFDLKTQFNSGDIDYGDYISKLKEVENVITKLNLKDEAKNQLKISLGLDENGVVDQYDALIKRLTSKEIGLNDKAARDFVDSLSAEELAVLVDIVPDLDAGTTIDEIKSLINDQLAEEFKFDIEVQTKGIEALNTALAESRSAAGLTSESIAALTARYEDLDGFNAAALFEKTANGIRLNSDELSRLEEQYVNTNKLEIDKNLNALVEKYQDVNNELKTNTSLTADERKELERSKESLADKIDELSTLASQYDGLTSAFAKWQNALNGAEEGDNYDSVFENLEAMKEFDDKGLVGTDAYKTFAQLMNYQDLSNASQTELNKAFDKGYKKAERYFTEGQKGSKNFLNDLHAINSEWAHINKDGVWEVDINAEEAAKKLGISVEAVLLILDKLKDYGIKVEVEDTSVDNLQTKIQKTEAKLKELGQSPVDINVDIEANSSNLGKIESEIEKAKSKIAEINKSSVSPEVKTAQLEDARAKLEALIQKKQEASQPAFMNLNTSQVNASLVDALEKVKEYQTALNELNKLNELKEAGIAIDGSEIDAAQKKIDDCAKAIQGLDGDVKVAIGLEEDGSIDSIKKAFEEGKVKIDANTDPAATKIEQLAENVDKISDKDVTINVTVNGLNDVKELVNQVEKLDKKIDLATKIDGSIDKLSEYTENAQALQKIGNITSSVNAEVKGNVIDEFEYKIDNLKVFSDSAKDIHSIGHVSSKVTADIDGNIFENSERTIDNLKTYTDSAKDIKKFEGNISSKITADINGDVFDKNESTINNLEVFVESAKGIKKIEGNITSNITANTLGSVFTDKERSIDNLDVYIESAKGIRDIEGNIVSNITADVDGSVFTDSERTIDNLKVFIDSAKGIKDFEGDTISNITANTLGNVFTDSESTTNNLKTFIESAQGIKDIQGDIVSNITANTLGSVFTDKERSIDNLKVFIESAKGIKDIEGDIVSNITANTLGSVFTDKERSIDNLKVFTESAKGIKEIEGDIVSNITANTLGSVFTDPERETNNLKVFVDSAKGIKDIEGDIVSNITANTLGSVFTDKERSIDNLKVFIDSAKGIKEIEGNISSKITADVDGNVFDKYETTIDNLGVFVKSAKGIKSIEGEVSSKVTANVYGNVLTSEDDKISNLGVFADNANKLKGLGNFSSSVSANATGNVVEGEGASSRLSSLTEFKSIVSGMTNQTVTVSVTAKVDSENVNAAIDLLKKVADSGVFKNYNATVQVGAKIAKIDDTVVQNYKAPSKDSTVKYSVDPESSVYTWTAPPKDGVVNYSASVEALTDAQKHKTGTITYKANIIGFGGVAQGTAKANGTTFGRAFARGDWGIKGNGVALGGELGTEVVVRNGKWFTIGDQGAQFFRYKKNDIVFNASQTEALFKYGGLKGANPRGKMLATGTAFSGGTAFASGLAFSNSSADNNDGFYGNKDGETEFETFDWLETLLTRLERTVDKFSDVADDTYKSWTVREDALTEEIKSGQDLINGLKNARTSYLGAADKVDLSSDLKQKVREGAIDPNDDSIPKDVAEKIREYQDLYEKYLSADEQLADELRNQAERQAQYYDNIIDRYDGILEGFNHTESMIDEYISQAEAKGHLVSGNYYQALIDNNNNNVIPTLTAQRDEMIAERNRLVAEGMSIDSEQYREMSNEIDGVTQDIESARTQTLEWQNEIRQINWDNLDLAREKISNLNDEAEFFVDLMSNKKLFNDDGSMTNEGLSTMGMYAQKHNTHMYLANDYKAEIEEIDKEIASLDAKGDYDENLNKRRQELIELQRESILAAEDEKQAIKDLITEGYDKELDALQEKIDKTNEAIDSQKDLLDHQRDVEKQTKNIASLEKRLKAYEGFEDEETRATVQQLKVELSEAKSDLESTLYDRYISDQSALLDELYLEYETVLNERLDNLGGLIEESFATVNEKADIINATLSGVAGEVGTEMSEELGNIWSGENGIEGVVTRYYDGFNTSLASVVTTLEQIKDKVVGKDGMTDKSDKEAKNNIKKPITTTSATSNHSSGSGGSKPPSSSGGNKSTGGDGKVKIGDRVKFLSGKYYYDSQGVNPAGSKNHGKYVYITNVNNKKWATHPIHISTGKKLGSGDLGWLKKNQISGYATGKKNFSNNEIAWTQEKGREFIVRPSDGAILTPVAKGDSVLNAQASGNIWNMANNPAEFIKDSLKLDAANVPNGSSVNNSYSQHIDNVVFRMDNVKNYEELLYALRDDRRFEKLVTAMTIDRVAGKSNLTKGKSIR